MPRKKKVSDDEMFERIVEAEESSKTVAGTSAKENDDFSVVADELADADKEKAEILNEISSESKIEYVEDEAFETKNDALFEKMVNSKKALVSKNEQKLKEIIAAMENQDEAFRKRRYEVASRSMRRKLYENEHIISYAGEQAQTYADKKHAEAQYLLQLAQSVPPVPITGKIIGIENFNNKYAAKVNIIDERELGIFDVLIPVAYLFPYNVSDYEGYVDPEVGRTRMRDRLQSMVGAVIRFVIYDVKEERMVALGSRVKAMELTSNYYYRRATGNNRVFPGVLANAKVVSTRRDRVICDVLGADVEIKSNELSWTALDTVDNEFSVGDVFPVRIETVKPFVYKVGENSMHLYSVTASRRAALPDPKEEFFDSYNEGGIYSGIVKTGSVEQGFFVTLNGRIDCVCKPGNILKKIVKGCECTVAITKKDPEKKRLNGIIIDVTK